VQIHGHHRAVRSVLMFMGALALLVAGCGTSAPAPTPSLRLVYRVLPVDGKVATPGDMDAIRAAITNRLADTGVATLRVVVEGGDRIVIETSVTGAAADEVRALAGTTGRLDFVPLGQTQVQRGQALDLTQFPPLFSGGEVAVASIGADQTGRRTVDLVLREPARQAFAVYTAAHVGDFLAIVLDGRVVSAPVINEAIPGGEIQISLAETGGLELAEAQRLVTFVGHGALPYPLEEVAPAP
jgi:preprotein translocase subunit SecD